MAEDSTDVLNSLRDELNSIPSMPSAPAAPSAQDTVPVRHRRPVTQQDRDRTSKMKLARATLVKVSQTQKVTALGNAKIEFSRRARICGLTFSKNDRYDFSLPSVTKKAEGTEAAVKHYRLTLTHSAPSGYEGVIVLYPQALRAFIAGGITGDMNELEKAKSEAAMDIEIIDQRNFVQYLQDNTANYMYEAEETWSPITKHVRSGAIGALTNEGSASTIEDYNKCLAIPSYGIEERLPAWYIDLATSSQGEIKYRLKTNTRARLVTPTNYIARSRYQVMHLPATLTPDQAKLFTAAYLGRFMSAKDNDPNLIRLRNMVPEQVDYFNIDDVDGIQTIKENRVFTTDSSRSVLRNFKAKHWFKRDPHTGDLIEESISDVGLVAKEKVPDKETYRTVSDTMVDANSPDPLAYRFDKNWPVVKATGGRLTYQTLVSFWSQRRAASNSGRRLRAGGAMLMGSDLKTIQALIASSAAA